MSRRLSIRDVIAVVEKVPDLSGIVLVGGQALNFWAEQLGIVTADTELLYGPALSDDIDFLGPAKLAIAFSDALGGTAQIAGMDNAHSPNTALVTLDIDGENHLIDFLGDMKGFSSSELKRVKDWAVPARMRGTPQPMYVMHPAHCLEAQLENVYGTALDRRAELGGERYVGRVRLAIEACRQIILKHLQSSDMRSALKVAEKVHELSLLPTAMRARRADDLRVESAIVEGPEMPKEFLEKRLPRLRAAHERKLRKYEDRQKGQR